MNRKINNLYPFCIIFFQLLLLDVELGDTRSVAEALTRLKQG